VTATSETVTIQITPSVMTDHNSARPHRVPASPVMSWEGRSSSHPRAGLDRAQLFAEDGDWRVGPGTFTGKDGVRRLFEWDVSLSPTLTSQEEGVGIVAKGTVGFRAHRVEQTAEGIPISYPCLSVFEVNEAGKIQHVRSYYDKLGIMHNIASKYPGVKGWFFRKMVNTLVAQGEKGLKR